MKTRLTMALAVGALVMATPLPAEANHAWGTYHWARSANPVRISVIDSMTADWDDNLSVALSDTVTGGIPIGWDYSSVLAIVPGGSDDTSRTRKRCAAVSGKVRACNATYGKNGWLGLAQIWISGGHIVQATAKMNDSYLASSQYGETARQQVMCQEIGHDWGLGHQDESGADLNTCMDYANALDNPYPNTHDYEQLQIIYGSHLESASSSSATAGFLGADVHAKANWGKKVHEAANGRSAVFVRDFGAGLKVVTHVTWVR